MSFQWETTSINFSKESRDSRQKEKIFKITEVPRQSPLCDYFTWLNTKLTERKGRSLLDKVPRRACATPEQAAHWHLEQLGSQTRTPEIVFWTNTTRGKELLKWEPGQSSRNSRPFYQAARFFHSRRATEWEEPRWTRGLAKGRSSRRSAAELRSETPYSVLCPQLEKDAQGLGRRSAAEHLSRKWRHAHFCSSSQTPEILHL